MPGKFRIKPIRRQGDEDLILGVIEEIGDVEEAFSFFRAAFAGGQNSGEPPISGAVSRETQQTGTIIEIEPDADHDANSGFLGRGMGAHDAGDRIAIGDRDGPVAELRRGLDQLFGMGGPAQEAEIAGHLQFGVVHAQSLMCQITHAKSPCRYQAGFGLGWGE